MEYLAIRNKKTGRFVCGTDFNYSPPRQIYATEYRPPILLCCDSKIYSSELKRRGIRLKNFDLVKVWVVVEGRKPTRNLDTHTREGLENA